MAKSSGTENINHIAGIRLRVIGNGDLIPEVASLDDIITKTLTVMPMTSTARIEPYRIVNFVSQRATLKLTTTQLDEWFQINTIVIFLKPIFSQYPS